MIFYNVVPFKELRSKELGPAVGSAVVPAVSSSILGNSGGYVVL